MKAKNLLLLLLFTCLAVDVSSKQQETEATLREIKIRATGRISPRNMRTASLRTSVMTIAPTSYIVGESMAINFASPTTNASIVVTNAETGEVVHHELFTCGAPTTVVVDLQGCESGVYYLEIGTSTTDYDGEFVL